MKLLDWSVRHKYSEFILVIPFTIVGITLRKAFPSFAFIIGFSMGYWLSLCISGIQVCRIIEKHKKEIVNLDG